MNRKNLILSSIFIIVVLLIAILAFKVNNAKINEENKQIGGKTVINNEEIEDKIKDEENNKYSWSNAKILTQIQDEDFWNQKIEETIDTAIWWEKWNIKILWYWLLCQQSNENLGDCNYSVSFSNEVDRWWRTGYEVYTNSSSTSSRQGFSYHLAAKEIAMNDIWNWWIFFDVSNRDDDELIIKYLWKDFKSTYDWDYWFIEVVEFVTNNEDWTSNHHLYIITDETWEILYKNSERIISRDATKKIIANTAWIDESNVKYLYYRSASWVYECSFSYKWHTYKYENDAGNWTIIKGWDEIDIWEEAAMGIAIKDAWIDWKDLMQEVDHWHMRILLEPDIEKIWSGNSALYRLAITTNKDKYYLYDISAFDGRILSSKFGEKFVINNKNWDSKDLAFQIESAFPKKQKLDIKIHELKMDNIYEFKDLIYFWIEFEWDKIVDWSIIDKHSNKNLGKLTKKELDELYNFESFYKIKDMGILSWETINLSSLEENVIYKYSLPKWNYSDIEVVNDLWEDIIVYENMEDPRYKDKSIKYTAKPYLKDGYTRGSRAYYYHDGWEVFYVMYKKASTEDLLKVIDKNEITFLSKYNVWDKISEKDRSYDENYLYNNTNKDLTVLITNEIGSKAETMEVIVKSWKIVHCSEYADSVTILN